ncbi:hypothetical protein E6H34_04935 [Candidatus Bathyarchaeota archaeon]|nr:MAG: hypothetical protein E6H34_04935 [Candidatus Bathyarchaeota archaeon]
MVTHAEAKIHRVGPRHTIYLAKDLVEDSTFPFRVDEDLTVRIEGDALIIDKDGRSGRRPTKLDEAHGYKDKILTKTLDILSFSPLTSKAERINQMLSEIHEAEMLESRVRHMPKNEHAIFLWEEETFLDMVLSEFFDQGATGKAPKGLFSQKDLSGLDKPEAIKKIRGWMAEVHASNETNLPTRIAVEDYSWFLQNGLSKGLMDLEQSIGRRVKENMTILCGYNVSKLTDPKPLEMLLGFHGYAILDQPFRAYRREEAAR